MLTLAFKYHHLFETDYKKRSDIKKHPVTVSGFAVYTEANELFKKSVLKNFLHFSKHLKIFKNYFSGGNNYRLQT
jgi:hypothetical protein